MDNRVLGTCHACDEPIVGGDGIHIDADSRKWHPECHAAEVRQRSKNTNTSEAPDAPRRGPGRPRKNPEAEPATT